MKELIERLEQAEAGSRELDAEIARAVDFGGFAESSSFVKFDISAGALTVFNSTKSRPKPYAIGTWAVPHYTADLDAALTLVPKGWLWKVSLHNHPKMSGRALAEIWPQESRLGVLDGGCAQTAQTPALALCIACLRARSEDAAP